MEQNPRNHLGNDTTHQGVEDTEQEAYLDDHPRVVPLFEIDIMETATEYAPTTALKEEAYELEP